MDELLKNALKYVRVSLDAGRPVRRRFFQRLFINFVALLVPAGLLMGCSSGSNGAPASNGKWAAAHDLVVEQAWVRAAPPTAEVGAGYLRLRNNSKLPARLLGASTAVASSVEIHNMTMQDGMMRMRRIEQVEIAPGQIAALAPGGDHLMLFGLNDALVAGHTLTMELKFAGGVTKSTVLQIRRDPPE